MVVWSSRAGYAHVCGYGAYAQTCAEGLFQVIRDQPAEDGVNVERRFGLGQSMQSKPQARHAICGMKVNLICDVANIGTGVLVGDNMLYTQLEKQG